MKREDFDKIFTEHVNKYLQKGYLISTEYKLCNCASSDFILINSTKNIKIRLWFELKYNYKELSCNNIIVFKIGIQLYDDNNKKLLKSDFTDNIIYEKTYFSVTDEYKKWYTDDYEEALRCHRLHDKRIITLSSTRCHNYYSRRFIDYGWNWFKDNKPRWMWWYSKEDITCICKYQSLYNNNKDYFLFFKDGNYIQINKSKIDIDI